MGGRGLAVQQAGGGEQERAGANACHKVNARVLLLDPGEDPGIRDLLAGTPTARNDHDTQVGMLIDGEVRLDQKAVAAAHHAARPGDDMDIVELGIVPGLPFGGRDREHLEWSAEVEHFDILEDQDAHLRTMRRKVRIGHWSSSPCGLSGKSAAGS